MNPNMSTSITDEERRAAGYELRPAASGDGLVFHDLRRANRPPGAALNPVDAAFLGIEDRLRVAMDQRDSLVEQIKALEGQRATLERHLKRSATYWAQKWMSARRTIKLLMVIGGSVLAVETLALAGLLWGLL